MIILGGTFDPPHLGHLVAAECARHQFGEDRVVFLPAGDPYRKSRDEGRDVTPAAMRLEMVRLAIAGNSAFHIDDREMRRDGPTYTVDTLRELAEEGVHRPVMIFGADAVEDMARWREPEAITELARIAVAPKAGTTLEALPAGGTWLDMPLLDISSTLIRERVAQGAPIRYLVPEAVERLHPGAGAVPVGSSRTRFRTSSRWRDTMCCWPSRAVAGCATLAVALGTHGWRVLM
ncbi:MAG: nicotinate-nucleotide adenylyltransferase [Dehalococcoidia bacterium]|nr:nicotinate-nucleotide adenylyltransferase [Dehalococcoidia bacterium]